MNSSRFPLLDALRGIAAMWVFAFHYTFSDQFQSVLPHLHAVTRMGHLGVPMFFVISGYCISASAASSLSRGEPTRRFLYRRLRRIYPPYWFSVLVSVAVPFIVEGISAIKTGKFVMPDYGFISYTVGDWLMVVTLTKIFEPEWFTGINGVYWTLAIEVQFYLAVALAVMTRRLWRSLALVTFAAAGSLLFPGVLPSGVFLPYWPTFAAGAVLFAYRDLIPRWLFNAEPPRLLSTLGAMSYSLYLLHGPVRFLAMQLMRQIVPVGIAFDFATIGLTCFFCYGFYWICERPFAGGR